MHLLFLGEFLSIQFAARFTACFALASFFTSLSAAQQSAQPSNSESTQSQQYAPTKDQAVPAVQQSPSDHDKTDQDNKNQDKKDTTPVSLPGKVAGDSNDRLF